MYQRLGTRLRQVRRALAIGRHRWAFWHHSPWHWRAALGEESDYWDRYLDEFVDKHDSRLDPGRELASHLKVLLADVGPAARILDVGAGPLTVLGPRWDGHRLVIIAVDPLARQYDRLLSRHHVNPVVRSIKCDGERLTDLFGESQFDLAHAQNSIDHSYDPFRVIAQMVAVVKPGGVVVLDHIMNEAENECYSGLHQWNLDLRGDRFVIWNRQRTIDVASALEPKAFVAQAYRLENRWFRGEAENPWFRVVLRKATRLQPMSPETRQLSTPDS